MAREKTIGSFIFNFSLSPSTSRFSDRLHDTPCKCFLKQLKNNSGENAADVGANDVARESIRRLVSGEEPPGLPSKKKNSTSVRSSRSGGGTSAGNTNAERHSYAIGGGGTSGLRSSQSGSPPRLRSSQAGGFSQEWANAAANQHQPKTSSKKGQHRWGSAAPLTTPQSEMTGGTATSTGTPPGVVLGALAAGGSTATADNVVLSPSPGDNEGVGKGGQDAGAGGRPLLPPEQAMCLPKVEELSFTWKLCTQFQRMRRFDCILHLRSFVGVGSGRQLCV